MLSLVRIGSVGWSTSPRIVTYDDVPLPKCKMFYSLRSLWNRRRPEFALFPLVAGCGFAAFFLWAALYLQLTFTSRAIYLSFAGFWLLVALYMLLIILAPAPNPPKR